MVTIALLLMASLLIILAGYKWLWPRMVLSIEERRKEGYQSSPDYAVYLGKTGVALTPLRPAGVARIDNQRLDVVSEGEFLEKGVAIEVIRIEGYRLIVRSTSELK